MKKFSLVLLCFLSLICLMTCDFKFKNSDGPSCDITEESAPTEPPEMLISADTTIFERLENGADSTEVSSRETDAVITNAETTDAFTTTREDVARDTSEVQPQTTEAPKVEILPETVTSDAETTLSELVTSTENTAAADTVLKIVEMTSECRNSSSATVSAVGKPNTEYSISVFYSTQKSSAKGLENKTSDENGLVLWTWKVGARTKNGEHKIVIEGGGERIETYFTTYVN